MSISQKQLLEYKSEGVRDCVKHIKTKIKKMKKQLEEQKKKTSYYLFGWDSYSYEDNKELEIKIEILIQEKISLEKYMKKLKHQSKEC